MGHACSVTNTNHRGQIHWCMTAMTILLSFVRVARRDIYLKIKTGKIPHEDVGQFLSSLVGKDVANWWFKIYLTGLNRRVSDTLNLDLDDILRKAGFLNNGETMSEQDSAQYQYGWGHSRRDKLADIFDRIETVASF